MTKEPLVRNKRAHSCEASELMSPYLHLGDSLSGKGPTAGDVNGEVLRELGEEKNTEFLGLRDSFPAADNTQFLINIAGMPLDCVW